MKIIEPKTLFDINEFILKGSDVSHYSKKYSDVKNYYEHIDDSIKDDTIMYEVYSLETSQTKPLLIGITIIHPICVSGECNMTRGHYHVVPDEDEIYFGIEGNGLLVFMSKDGENFAEKVFPGSIHYISGKYAHRLINTGDSIFKVGASWNKLAGHDYESIENNPFPERIYKDLNNNIL